MHIRCPQKVTILVIAVLYIITSSNVSAATFGDTCATSKDCDNLKFLTCNGTCACKFPNDQVFNSEQDACVFKLGSPCSSYSNIPVELAEKYGLANFCVKNAKCTKGTCVCDDGHYETSEGTCEPHFLHLESCTENKQCDNSSGLTCSTEGICDCDPETAVFDLKMKKCAKKFGARCSWHNNKCASLMDCRHMMLNHGSNSSTYEERCVCDNTAYPTLEGKCEPKVDYGATCKHNRECNDNLHLACTNGTCQCNKDFSYNSTRGGKCIGLVGASCNYYYSSEHCVENARCQYYSDAYHYHNNWMHRRRNHNGPECRCNDDYYMNENRTCERRPGHGEQCSAEMPCRSNLNSIYSTRGSLTCDSTSGLCRCSSNGTYYDDASKACVKTLGSSCTWSSECGRYAGCQNGKCECWSYYGAPDPTGTRCVPGYGSSCNDTNQCDSTRDFVCRESTCQCSLKDHQYYDYKEKRCLTYAEAPCEDGKSTCVPNAQCVSTGEAVEEHECRCNDGFMPVDRQCQLGYGQACNATSPKCDQLGPLTCTDGMCQCGKYMEYDDKAMKCKGLVGATCHLSKKSMEQMGRVSHFMMDHYRGAEEDFCVEGAYCKGYRTSRGSYSWITTGICKCKKGRIQGEDGKCGAVVVDEGSSTTSGPISTTVAASP